MWVVVLKEISSSLIWALSCFNWLDWVKILWDADLTMKLWNLRLWCLFRFGQTWLNLINFGQTQSKLVKMWWTRVWTRVWYLIHKISLISTSHMASRHKFLGKGDFFSFSGRDKMISGKNWGQTKYSIYNYPFFIPCFNE